MSEEEGGISGADLEAPTGAPRKEVSSTVLINVVAGGVAIDEISRRASLAEATRLTAGFAARLLERLRGFEVPEVIEGIGEKGEGRGARKALLSFLVFGFFSIFGVTYRVPT